MTILSAARRLAAVLESADTKIVFAESCTGGLVSGALTRVPGISRFLCGGMVTYRNETKTAYLQVPAKLLRDPGPVSEIVAREMAVGILKHTPEAEWSAAVTGHLGPHAPVELDGVVFIAVAERGPSSRPKCAVTRYQCRAVERFSRQQEVIEQVLLQAATAIAAAG